MKIVRVLLISVLISMVCLMPHCSDSPVITGGGTRGGNPVVTGLIIGLDGKPAQNVQVTLIPSGYNCFAGKPMDSLPSVRTNSSGAFSIEAPDTGMYNVEARNSSDGSCLIKFNIATYHDSVSLLSTDTLQPPGSLTIILGEEKKIENGYLYVPGTRIGVLIDTSADTMTIDSVPVSVLPVLYLSDNKSDLKMINHDIPVRSNESTLISTVVFKPSLKILLNTTVTGAAVDKEVFDFPILIRLNRANFNFANAQSDGSDVVFKSGNGRILPYEIEKWDVSEMRAEIWVKVDTIHGNDSLQSIEMFWGDTGQTIAHNSNSVFDTAAGYQGVWHLGDGVNTTFRDVTVNNYDGTSNSNESPSVKGSMIGNGCYFNGESQYITMLNTSNSKLNFPENGYYTVSAWVLLDTLDGNSHCIVSKGFEQYYLRSTYISINLPHTTPLWEFVEFSDVDKWKTSTAQLSIKQWTLLVGVHQGTRQLLYCNGVLVDSTTDKWQNAVSRNTKNDLTLGKFAESVVLPKAEGYCYFNGGIDEVRICNIAQSSEWVKLCYMNQCADDKLVRFSN
jgi:hypothetical protein